MFQWDNALIFLGVTVFAASEAQMLLGFNIIYFYIGVAVFGSALAVGIRWWQGHLNTKIARVISFVAGVFGAAITSPFLMHKFEMTGLDAFFIIGLTSMIGARLIVMWTSKLDIERLGKAGEDRISNIIGGKKKE